MDTESRVEKARKHLNQLYRTVRDLGVLNGIVENTPEQQSGMVKAMETFMKQENPNREFILYHFETSDGKKWRLELEWIGLEVDGRPGAADMKVAKWRYSIVHDATNAAVITNTIIVPESESPPDPAAVANQVAEKMGDLLQSMITKSKRIDRQSTADQKDMSWFGD